MSERNKVIKALGYCIERPKCADCPWKECEYVYDAINGIPYGLLRDALELLEEQEYEIDQAYKSGYIKGYHDATTQEQEEVEPVFECEEPTLKIGQFHCGNCHCSFGISHFRFCPFCGRAIKWK